jgi:hypothetical protein
MVGQPFAMARHSPVILDSRERSAAAQGPAIYRANRLALPYHLITVRMRLDAKGLMNRDHFGEYVASASANQSAS